MQPFNADCRLRTEDYRLLSRYPYGAGSAVLSGVEVFAALELRTEKCPLDMSGPRLESRGNSIFLACSQFFSLMQPFNAN